MTHIESSRPSSNGFADRIGQYIAKSWAAYAAARERRAAIAELHALDDHALKDIGLHRSEIERVVHGRNGHDLE